MLVQIDVCKRMLRYDDANKIRTKNKTAPTDVKNKQHRLQMQKDIRHVTQIHGYELSTRNVLTATSYGLHRNRRIGKKIDLTRNIEQSKSDHDILLL